ncbi:MAG TPA: bifunctional serine/threonine-protein kinase/formylglycine-generating enzyme family protein [Anaerolineaceae bacterium]|nr:bifunctional serine/threonine-protein kinase/formylglycine-generating enzyme family protein [Anaerolineaceae bacterium]
MTTLGKYELHEQLGKGGFGTVYRAIDTSLGREVALKILHPQLMVDDTFVQRFIKEARTLASLEHPNIVPVHDLGESDGRLFIAMRYLPGGNLQELIRKSGHLDFSRALKIMSQVCDGLQTAHERELVHRDIKPANILFDARGSALISDFGLARAVQVSGSSMSSTSVGAGTPAYRAPELWRGKPPATPATDVYSLACMLVEMLTGKTLFDGSTPDEILTQHLIDGPALPELFPPDCPAGLRELILKALSKDPSARQQDAKAFFDEFSTARENTSLEPVVLKEIFRPSIVKPIKPKVFEVREMILDLGGGVKMEFVYVPAGRFLMGSDPEVDKMAEPDEQPQHKVFMDEYWIGKFPVTTRQFSRFITKSKNNKKNKWKKLDIDDRPMVDVTWDEARNFCEWLSITTNKLIELPTEAQWEKAARGTDGRIYPWGNQEPDITSADFGRGSDKEPDATGTHPKGCSPYGAQDMAGCVYEWVADLYAEHYYISRRTWNNPKGPASGDTRVLRGGSWTDREYDIRCANRDKLNPSDSGDFGFRCFLNTRVTSYLPV